MYYFSFSQQILQKKLSKYKLSKQNTLWISAQFSLKLSWRIRQNTRSHLSPVLRQSDSQAHCCTFKGILLYALSTAVFLLAISILVEQQIVIRYNIAPYRLSSGVLQILTQYAWLVRPGIQVRACLCWKYEVTCCHIQCCIKFQNPLEVLHNLY